MAYHMNLSASEPIYTYNCQARILLKKHLATIIFAFIALAGVTYKVRSWIYNYRVQGFAKHLYQELK